MIRDLGILQERIWQNAEDHGWHTTGESGSVPVKLALIHSEVSEALEEYRNSPPECEILHIYYNDDSEKPEGFGVELADVVIRVLDLAHSLDIDMVAMINLKHEYNQTRSYRHGNKRV